MQRLLWICLAGGLGTGARYLIGLWATSAFSARLPAGTLLVNLIGCFLITLVMHVALALSSFPATLRLVLTTGFLGGLTTYSSFNYEMITLLQSGAVGAAVMYFAATTVGCFASGLAGWWIAWRLLGG